MWNEATRTKENNNNTLKHIGETQTKLKKKKWKKVKSNSLAIVIAIVQSSTSVMMMMHGEQIIFVYKWLVIRLFDCMTRTIGENDFTANKSHECVCVCRCVCVQQYTHSIPTRIVHAAYRARLCEAIEYLFEITNHQFSDRKHRSIEGGIR